MAIELPVLESASDLVDGATRRQADRLPALNMEEVELVSPTGAVASVWLGDESRGGMGVLVLGAAVGAVNWLQVGIHVEVRQGKLKRQAVVRHCTLDTPTVMFVGLEWVRKTRATTRPIKAS
jgi:hypothetical protein